MADAETNTPSLAQHYLLKEIRNKPEMAAKSVEESVVEPSAGATTEETADKADEIPAFDSEVAPFAEEDEKADVSTIKESNEPSLANENNNEADQAPLEESSGSAGSDENAVNEEAEETPEIKLETAPADFRFPTTNQTRHCFTRYIEHHRCVAAKGEGAPECEKFAKYYRSLCPGEWIERWNEQRENGTFPGPL